MSIQRNFHSTKWPFGETSFRWMAAYQYTELHPIRKWDSWMIELIYLTFLIHFPSFIFFSIKYSWYLTFNCLNIFCNSAKPIALRGTYSIKNFSEKWSRVWISSEQKLEKWSFIGDFPEFFLYGQSK
jgi:hypothetical protein